MPMVDGDRVVVAVSSNASCKDAVRWAIANKIRKPEDTLVFLHIVSKIPSPMGVEMYQSEVNNTMFVHFVRTVVQPMMLQLKKMVDSKVRLELKVARNNAVDKGLVDESRKLNASVLCLGAATKSSLFGGSRRSMASGTGAYCVKSRPPGIAVFVIQKEKVIMSTESMSIDMSPHSSASTSPAHSGRLATSNSGEVQGDSLLRTLSSGSGKAKVDVPGPSSSDKLGSFQESPSRGKAAEKPIEKNFEKLYEGEKGEDISNIDQWVKAVQGRTNLKEQNIQSTYKKTINNRDKLFEGEKTDDVSNIDQWAKSIQDRAIRDTHTSYMKDLEARLSHARAALASFPTFIQDAVSQIDPEEHTNLRPTAAAPPHRAYGAPVPVAMPSKAKEPIYVSMDENEGFDSLFAGGAGSSGIEGALLRELAVMRKKAAEADKARKDAELRAEQLMAAADMSLREVENQAKQRNRGFDSLAMMQKLTRDLAKQAAEEEAAKKAAEARKAAAEAEALRRKEIEEIARREIAIRSTRHYQKYTWNEISAATDNWSPDRKIGEGGFGTVYKGTVHHTPVAIKILKNSNAMQAETEFQQEVEVLGQIQHPHIVMLLGCCPEKYSLVYEFMAHGSLEDRLACKGGTAPMPWYVRFRVVAEVASALLALHTRPVPIVHRDLKPANILLTKNYVAKLGDVGLAKLMPDLNDNRSYLRDSNPVGTFAYVDPEFQRTGEYGPKSDVYALGIVLLDLLTGRKPSIYEHLEEAVDDRDVEKFQTYLDPSGGKWPLELTMEVAVMAVRCSEMRRRKRPDLERDVMPLLDKASEEAVKAEEEEVQKRSKSAFGDAPSCLYCPITQEIMVDPVLASDGHTYELVAIQQWLETNDRSPMTNNKLPNKDIVPNHAVRSMIHEFQERRGMF